MAIRQIEELVRLAHAGQVDKAGQPYWQHPLRVREILVRMFPDASIDEQLPRSVTTSWRIRAMTRRR